MQQKKNNKKALLIRHIGATIKKRRMEKTNHSQTAFAYGNDLNKGTLSRLEAGIFEPKISTLWKIAEAFDIPMSELIKEIENELPKGFCLTE